MKNVDLMDDCLKELFRRVGLRYSAKFVSQENWYRENAWTKEAESEYKMWLVNELRTRGRMRKRYAEQEAGLFLLQYGWTYVPEGCLGVMKECRICE